MERLLKGDDQFNLNLNLLANKFIKAASPIRKDFRKIRDAAQVSYFSDLVHKVGSLSTAMQLGVHATTIGSNQYDNDSLRWTLIKRRLGDGLEFEEDLYMQNPERILAAGNFLTIKRLENLSRGYFQGQKSGAFESFYYQLNDENTATPDTFTELDQRQSPSEWLDYELYKFCVATFSAESAGRSNLPLKLSSSNIASFFTPRFLREHLIRKLYTEMYTLEKLEEAVEDAKTSMPFRQAAAARQDPKLLDWKRVLDNDLPIKKYIAYETFAYQGYGRSQTNFERNMQYFEELSEQMYDFNAEKFQPRVPEVPEKETKPEPFQMERFYEEVVNSMAATKSASTDALKADLAESLDTVSKRLKLYR
jgi:hypothetical protein